MTAVKRITLVAMSLWFALSGLAATMPSGNYSPPEAPNAAPIPLTSQWTASSRLYSDGPGKFIYDGSIGAQNYQAPWKGITDWTEIAPNWLPIPSFPVPDGSLWDWEQVVGTEYTVRAMANIAAGPVIEWEVDGSTLLFTPNSLNWRNDLDQLSQIAIPSASATFTISDTTLGFTDAFIPGVDLTWSLENTRLRKELTVAQSTTLPPPPQFILDGGNPVLELAFVFTVSNDLDLYINGSLWDKRTEIDTIEIIEFRRSGEVLFAFQAPRAIDSNLNEPSDTTPTLRFKKQGPSIFVTILTAKSWLDTAVYPVVIDPTLDLQVGAGADDATETDSNQFFTSTLGRSMHNASSTAVDRKNGGSRFTNVTIGQGDTIDVAYLITYSWGSNNDDPRVLISMEDVDNAVSFATNPDVTNRTRTSASSSYEDDGIHPGPDNTSSIVIPVQEVVDRGGFASGNAMVAFIDGKSDAGTKSFETWAYESSTALTIRIHIEYTAAGGEEATVLMAYWMKLAPVWSWLMLQGYVKREEAQVR